MISQWRLRLNRETRASAPPRLDLRTSPKEWEILVLGQQILWINKKARIISSWCIRLSNWKFSSSKSLRQPNLKSKLPLSTPQTESWKNRSSGGSHPSTRSSPINQNNSHNLIVTLWSRKSSSSYKPRPQHKAWIRLRQWSIKMKMRARRASSIVIQLSTSARASMVPSTLS